MASIKYSCVILSIIFGLSLYVNGIPVESSTESIAVEETTNNGTHKELYVVKVLTYEVGILADVPNNETTNGTAEDPEVHQKVDLSFYDTDSNGTFLNFGDIPLPVQTNVSGQIITGIAPVHIGAVQNINEALEALPFSGTIVNITHSDTSYLTVDRENVTDQEQQTILKDDADLAKLPILNNVLLPDSFDKAEEQIEKIEHQKKS